jgi:23S rRNA pseudouridine2605 synthase
MTNGTPRRPAVEEPTSAAVGERLHKYLASTGAGSRRECETFIAQGRVTVNGKVVTRMGVKVDPASDAVTLDGEPVQAETRVYFLVHKPVGTICTNADEMGRPRVVDLVRPHHQRIYTVGRLDADSTGLILLTNDGAIANVICHPRYRIEKLYQVVVRGEVSRDQIAKIEAGVWLSEGKSSPARVRPVSRNPQRNETILEMTLFEGRNREIRRVFGRVGLTVRRLVRTRLGPLTLGDLAPGAWRRLDPGELAFVHEAERLYVANREAWDAELPDESRRRFRPKKRRPAGPGARGPGLRPDRRAVRGPSRRAGGGPWRGSRRPDGGGRHPHGGSGPRRPSRGQ